jgi:uncharacterized protein
MKALSLTVASLFLLFASLSASAQQIQIGRDNRTVAVSATATAIADPEITIISLTCQSYGRTRDAAYSDNTQTASKIIDALLGAGVKQDDIETSEVHVSLVDSSEQRDMTAAERKDKQFEAGQTWQLRVPPADAQGAVDRAVAAGAEVGSVSWAVADPDALGVKAQATALSKARELAEQMAHQFGGKLGQLLFVSNTDPLATPPWLNAGARGQTVTVEAAVIPSLKLFPQKVRRDVTVYAVFALE